MFNKYFQDELSYLRELGREFSQAYPKLAPMLADRGVDPDVERLLEGVAFLTGRIRQKLDDEVPEFLQSVGFLLFPHLMRPLPSASILQINPDRQRATGDSRRQGGNGVRIGPDRRNGVHVPLVGRLLSCRPWPSRMPGSTCWLAAGSRLSITLRSMTGKPIGSALPNTLRLHFTGETQVATALLFAVHQQTADVVVSTGRGREAVARARGGQVGRVRRRRGAAPHGETCVPGLPSARGVLRASGEVSLRRRERR